MKLYSSNKDYKLYQGNMLDMLEVIEPNTIDSIITDPPYELNFMNKGWDNSGIAFQPDTWQKCYEVLKPGGYLLAFGGSRTFHRIACAIEDAGFEIRDTIMWLYGSGFPKSMNVGLTIDKKNGVESKVIGKVKGAGSTGMNKAGNQTFIAKNQYADGTHDIKEAQNKWNGWGTALKPSFEPIIVARKPLGGTVAKNCLKYGVGGINIDECRVGNEEMKAQTSGKTSRAFQSEATTTAGGKGIDHIGRFPANTILTYDDSDYDNESWLRYFYCAKASKKDRDEGLEEFDDINGGSYQFRQDGSLDGKIPVRKNTHPTVKPTELMQYLVRLVSPDGATILDPFNGSGSTGKAVMYENRERHKNYKYIGIELTEEYLPLAKARIEYVKGD